MVGGKEILRQKMIGMMYLVLIVFLVLNVFKFIFDVFVVIEENIQKLNIVQLDCGDGFKVDVNGELKIIFVNVENVVKCEKLGKIFKQMDVVDKLMVFMIEEIDKIKVEILKEFGENVIMFKENDEQILMWKKGGGVVFICMNLMVVQVKDQYDILMYVIVGEDIKILIGEGKKLWDNFNKFCVDLIKMIGIYNEGGKNFLINFKVINEYKINVDFVKVVDKMIVLLKVNVCDDGQVLKDIYINFIKLECLKVYDMEGVYWIGVIFDYFLFVVVVVLFFFMEQDILFVCVQVFVYLKFKVFMGEYLFNKIVGLVYGFFIVNIGDEVELKVMMVVFDFDNQLIVMGFGVIMVVNGQGMLKMKVFGGVEMVLIGMVFIKNKLGVVKIENWMYMIKIMKLQGIVFFFELNVLYKGYDNKVEGVVFGYDQMVLSGSNCLLIKLGIGYIVCVSGGKEVIILIFGKNFVINKMVLFGFYKFCVMNFLNLFFFWGVVEEGGKGFKVEFCIFVKYFNSLLNVMFQVLDYELNVVGVL